MTLRFYLIALALVATETTATGERPKPEPRGYLDRIIARIDDALQQASAMRKPKPPQPVPVQWRPRNRGSLDLGAPLLALESADLDGDGSDELIALTTAELVVLSTARLGQVRARSPLPAKFAVSRSRDPVGTISVEGRLVAVRTSEQAVGARYSFGDDKLALVEELGGFPLCRGVTARLRPGRNVFDPDTLAVDAGAWPAGFARPKKPFYAVECRDHISDDGRQMRTIALSSESRVVSVQCDKAGEPCPASSVSSNQVEAAGVGFEVADVDRDGHAEVIATRGQAPGRPDRVRVFASTSAGSGLVFSKSFSGGVVAVSAIDLDGDGSLEVIAAVRIVASVRLNLWILNRTKP